MKINLNKKWNHFKNLKISPLLLLLTVTFMACMLISNIIAVKTFPLFTVPGTDVQVLLPTACFAIYPVTYVVSDILSQVYGFKWSRRVAWIGFAMNLLMVGCFEMAIALPGETDLSVLGSTWFMLIASLISYIVGGWVNDIIFKVMKRKDGNKGLLARCLISSVAGQFTDSLIYLPLAMYIFPKLIFGCSFMSLTQLGLCILIQPTIKLIFEVVVSPLTKFLCNKLHKIETEAGNFYEDEFGIVSEVKASEN